MVDIHVVGPIALAYVVEENDHGDIRFVRASFSLLNFFVDR